MDALEDALLKAARDGMPSRAMTAPRSMVRGAIRASFRRGHSGAADAGHVDEGGVEAQREGGESETRLYSPEKRKWLSEQMQHVVGGWHGIT